MPQRLAQGLCILVPCRPCALVVRGGTVAVMVVKEALQGGPLLRPCAGHGSHVGVMRFRMRTWTCSITHVITKLQDEAP